MSSSLFTVNLYPLTNLSLLPDCHLHLPASESHSSAFYFYEINIFRFHIWKGYAAFIFPCLFFNLCIMLSKLIYVVSNHRIFLFIQLNNLSLCVNTVILVYSCVNEHFHICSTVTTAAIHMGMRICVWHSDLLPLDIYSGVGLLDHMVFLLWIFCRKSLLLPVMTIPM